MKKWYEPDQTWVAIGVRDREDYVKHYVVEGRFHANVHEDVVKAYQTAEHLMALAWYHYPMYDEALKKLLGMLEMAVKLKCQQLECDLEFINKRGKKEAYKLAVLIDKVCAKEKDKNLKYQLDKARNLRNHFAHPDRHSFMGGIAHQPIIPIINVLNLLFLDNEIVKASHIRLANLKQRFSMFQQGLFVLERSGKRILVTKAIPHQVYHIKDTTYTCWLCIPVLNNVYKTLSEHSYSPPIVLLLSNEEFQDSVLVGKEFQSDLDIKLSISTNSQDQEKLKLHEAEWNDLALQDQEFYRMYTSREIAHKQQAYQYQYCWS